jgi:hypothetical protein
MRKNAISLAALGQNGLQLQKLKLGGVNSLQALSSNGMNTSSGFRPLSLSLKKLAASPLAKKY